MRVILSRTDSIGDVILTLPMAGVLKQTFPECTIIFLGRDYTRPVIELSKFVDLFVSWDHLSDVRQLADLHADAIIHVFPVRAICKLSRQAGIPLRIATSHRFFTWFTCNRLLKIPRKNSNLHEAQLNLKMLQAFGIKQEFQLSEIPQYYGLTSGRADERTGGRADILHHLVPGKFNLILHPKSKGSAREWGLRNYSGLISLLPAAKFNIIITGTREEGESMIEFLDDHRGRVVDLTGKLTLSEFITLIGSCNGLVAASTGPLHIAAAMGIKAIGLYAPMRPIFPRRWAPLGVKADYLVIQKICSDCRKSMDCSCIRSINAEEVAEKLMGI